MKFLILTLSLLLLQACSSAQKSIETSPNSIVINSSKNLDSCKFLGVIETKEISHWQKDVRKTAALMGATHIQSSGPNYVGFNEIVSAFAYRCK